MPRPTDNPPNRFEETHVEWEGHPDWHGPAPPATLRVYEERGKTALSRNESPDVGFRWSLNAYRGCFHGCAYCYARPSHAYWGFGAGTDFERRIVVRTNVAELLDRTLSSRRWTGETIVLSGNTDCYQPLEARYRLTRRCLEVCRDHGNPASIITKSTLVRRDLDLLEALARIAPVHVVLSIGGLDDAVARALEPNAPPWSKRLETLRRVAAVPGVRAGVSLAPVIPGLTDASIAPTLRAAREAGASFAFMNLLRLPREVAAVFDARLAEVFPERADKVRNAIREMRGGRVNDPRFGARMRGEGPRWALVERIFETERRRLGLDRSPGVPADGGPSEAPPAPEARPAPRPRPWRDRRQLELFT